MKKYKCLDKQVFGIAEYQLVPIRDEDRFLIMQWRNDQIYHLRQKDLLTPRQQDLYFKNVVSKLLDQDQPDQLLFSFLKKDICIGYGGLVHLNWIDKNAEVSFVMDTSFEAKKFVSLWSLFLTLLKQVAFKELDLHKMYTYAFDLRPKLYEALSLSGFISEGRLKDHCIVNSIFYDVLFHSCINPLHNLSIREVKNEDSALLLKWRNDPHVRKYAFNTNEIERDSHKEWFRKKLIDKRCKMFIFETKQGHPVSQVRLEKKDEDWILNYSVDKHFRGIGLGKIVIEKSVSMIANGKFRAFVKPINYASIKTFQKLKFKSVLNKDNYFEFISVM
jgi:RimJ/RimL family protein N-acetyltransferase